MSVHAGSIIHLAGQNVIDRIQSAGLGNVNLPIDTVREVGNREVVDKIPQEPDFNFTLNSFNVSVEVMAWLTGHAQGSAASAASEGASDPDGTTYDWLDCVFVNIVSPWTNPATAGSGVVNAGHIVPAYYPTQLTYNFGVADNATQEVQLSGGSFYYADNAAPLEKEHIGNGSQKAYTPSETVIQYREGGVDGSTFRLFFGVLVNGIVQVKDVDYTEAGGAANPGASATLTFTTAPAAGAKVKYCFFAGGTNTAYPQTVHASTVVLPGAVRGRNIKVYIEGQRVSGIQSAQLTATVDATVDRELGNTEIIGRTVNGTDCNGTITVRAKDKDAFFDLMHQITGVSKTEVFGWFNDNVVDLQIKIENPKNPGQIIKTLEVHDAKFQPPGTQAQVNSPTDFGIDWSSVNGSFREVKGDEALDPHRND